MAITMDCLSVDEVSITSVIANNDCFFLRVRRLPKNHPGKWGDNREYEKCSLAHYFKFVLRYTSVSRALYATRSGRRGGRLQIYLDKFDSCALLQWETFSIYIQTVSGCPSFKKSGIIVFPLFFLTKIKFCSIIYI